MIVHTDLTMKAQKSSSFIVAIWGSFNSMNLWQRGRRAKANVLKMSNYHQIMYWIDFFYEEKSNSR